SGPEDGTAGLWDAATGRLVQRFAGHTGEVLSVAFAPDGRKILTVGADGKVNIWRVNGELLATMISSREDWLVLTPEGFFSASDKGTSLIHVVQGNTVIGIDQFYDALHRPDLVREKLAGDPQGKVREAAARLDLSKVVASGSAPRIAIVSPTSPAT